MNGIKNLPRWIIFAALSALLFSPLQVIQAQELKTIIATGSLTDANGDVYSLTMTFPPAGGKVSGIGIFEVIYPYGDGQNCTIAIQFNWEGTFEGGDGGMVTGTTSGTEVVNTCTVQHKEIELSGPWSGNFYANGTGSGVYDCTDKASQYYAGILPWQVTFSAEEFATALKPEVPVVSTPQPSLPVEPGEVVPGQPEVPTDQIVPTDSGGLFGIPIPVILGSLGIPVAGAFVGAVLSALLSGLSSAGASSAAVTNAGASLANGVDKLITEPIEANYQDQYWSERPWDEAGPGYVSKEEYERTKDMLEQGYKWTNGGWQTPDQISQSNQAQQNNRAATAREDAEWQAKIERERQALQQREAELKKTTDELQTAHNMLDLKDGLEAINQQLLNENVYVLNPLQGDPTKIVYGLNALKNLIWDNTIGFYTGSQGLTCQGYVNKTSDAVIRIVQEKFGPDTKVQRIRFSEISSVHPQSRKDDLLGAMQDWCDGWIDDNHNFFKFTLQDKSEWAVDFQQHNTGNKPPILRPYDEVKKVWQDHLGSEFIIEQ